MHQKMKILLSLFIEKSQESRMIENWKACESSVCGIGSVGSRGIFFSRTEGQMKGVFLSAGGAPVVNFKCPPGHSTTSLTVAIDPHARQLLRLFSLTIVVHHVIG